ncbi:MAG: AtpZ/AtpI family protein [Desulfobacteraceae bacterium]
MVSQVGLTMAGSILFCFAIGYVLDKWLGTGGLFIAIFIILGIIGGGVTVYRQIMKVLSPQEEENKQAENRNGSG